MKPFRRAVVATFLSASAWAQQVPDSTFGWKPAHPAFPRGAGPAILVDAGHHNFHTITGQFRAFATVARADGFRVESLDGPLTEGALSHCSVFVIASPRNAKTLESRARPILEAYPDSEIALLRRWVERGGSLLLVTDHMPIAGSMTRLTAAFGFHLVDGFATYTSDTTARVPMTLRRSDRTLRAHPVTDGRRTTERIDSIATFTGTAFTSDSGAQVMLELPRATVVIVPDEPWVFLANNPRIAGAGLSVGATRRVQKGRVALVAEAGMFTAQWERTPPEPMGMNHPLARQNPQFVLNLLRWLAR